MSHELNIVLGIMYDQEPIKILMLLKELKFCS